LDPSISWLIIGYQEKRKKKPLRRQKRKPNIHKAPNPTGHTSPHSNISKQKRHL
jgi:hypothetical protein